MKDPKTPPNFKENGGKEYMEIIKIEMKKLQERGNATVKDFENAFLASEQRFFEGYEEVFKILFDMHWEDEDPQSLSPTQKRLLVMMMSFTY